MRRERTLSRTSQLIDVIDNRGRTLTPCQRKVAQREVRLNRAKWISRNKIRLRFDPFAYRHIRLKVLKRDRYTCYWCGAPGFTIDHVIPWSKGGRTNLTNCICACQECNGERGDLPAEEFAQLKQVPPPKFDPNGQLIMPEPANRAPRRRPATQEDEQHTDPFALRDLLDPLVPTPSRRAIS